MKNIRRKSTRYMLAIGTGLAIALIVGLSINWSYELLAGWDAIALLLLVTIMWDMHGATAKMTAITARRITP